MHFPQPLLQALAAQGIRTAYVTVHVGPGTFKPVTCEDIRRHVMDPEWYELPAATARLVNETRATGGRLVAVGSTAVRVDRKSTRLNSSHLVISYAVFCLKKKKNIHNVLVTYLPS